MEIFMNVKAIPFNAAMAGALLEGRKTQTRRGLSLLGHDVFSEFGVSSTTGYDWCFRDEDLRWHELRNDELLKRLRYQTGDRIWVREAFSGFYFLRDLPPRDWPLSPIWYWADGNPAGKSWTRPKPSIHMPRWASRLTLIVTDVRVQRLKDISEQDAIAEGATFRDSCSGFGDLRPGWSMDWSRVGEPSRFATGADGKATPLTERDVALGSARYAFANFWNTIYGPDAWDANPWVSAITFTVHHGNIDQMGAA
jgi:hypothetical protein